MLPRPKSLDSLYSASLAPRRPALNERARDVPGSPLTARSSFASSERAIADAILFLAQNATEGDLRAALLASDCASFSRTALSEGYSKPLAKDAIISAVSLLVGHLRSLPSPLLTPQLVKDVLVVVDQDSELSDPVERALVLHMAAHQFLSAEKERLLYAVINMLGACTSRNARVVHSCPWIARDFAPVRCLSNCLLLTQQKGPHFGVPLEDLLRRSPSPNRVPWLVSACSDALRPYLTTTEGLFRIAGDEKEVNALRTALQSSQCVRWTGAYHQPHVLASILQRFLIELPDSLLTEALYDQLLTAVLVSSESGPLLQALRGLPASNRAVLVALCSLLRLIATHEATTRMGTMNLAIVFGPILLRTPLHKGLDKRALRLQCKVVSTLISLPSEELNAALLPDGLNLIRDATSMLACFISHDAQIDFVSNSVELDATGKPTRLSKEVAQVVVCSDLSSLQPLQSVLIEYRDYFFTKQELQDLLHKRVTTPNVRRRPSILAPILRSLSFDAETPVPEPIISVSQAQQSLLAEYFLSATNALDTLADTIFRADACLYARIPRTELSRGRYKLDHSHFALYAKHFNQLAMWAASEIVLQGKDIARRTQALRAGMQLSNLLRQRGDFSAAYAVFGGLSHAAVSRLAKTWSALHGSDVAAWEELSAFFSTDGDWKLVRGAMAAVPSGVPVVPYLGMYTRRVTAIEEGNATNIGGHINVAKFEMLHTVVTEFTQYQARCAAIIGDAAPPPLVLPILGEDMLYTQSRLLEPTKGTSMGALS